MAKRQASKRLQQAVENYLASLGSSREQLTGEQWEIIVDFVKSRRTTKPLIASFLILGSALLCLTFLYSRWTKIEIARATPIETVYLYNGANRTPAMPLSPYEVRSYLKSLARLSFNTGPPFILAVFLIVCVFIIPLHRRANRKILEAFIPRKQEAVSLADRPSSPEQ